MYFSKLFVLTTLVTTTTMALPQRGGGRGGGGRRPQIRPPQNPGQFDPPPPSSGGNPQQGGGVAAPPAPAPPSNNVNVPSQVNTAVIPSDFGITAGAGRDQVQAGACTGANNAAIPCDCPPAANDPGFLGQLTQALTQGFFPDPSISTPIDLARFNDASDTSVQTNRDRATAMVQVLQSNKGAKGQGCPGVAYPFLVSQQRTGIVGAPAR